MYCHICETLLKALLFQYIIIQYKHRINISISKGRTEVRKVRKVRKVRIVRKD